MVSFSAVLYYAFLFVGGVAFGYFVMRLTKPDSRLMDATQKLGASALYGFVLFAIAFALDYVVSGERFFEATGFLPITLFFTVLLSLFFLKLSSMLSKPEFLVVGVPASKEMQMPDLDKSFLLKEETPKADVKQAQAFEEIIAAKPALQAKPAQPKPEPLPVRVQPAPPAFEIAFEPRQKPPEHKKISLGEFFEGVKHALGVSKAKKQEQELEVFKPPEREKPAEPIPAAEIAKQVTGERRENILGEDSEFKQQELKKIKETELEQIAKELVGEEKGGESEIMHRRYLERKAEQEKKTKESETPEQEFEGMVQEVYNQLQISKERAEVSDKLKLSPPPAEEKVEQKIALQKGESAITPALLFAQEPSKPTVSQAPPSQSASIFDKLNVISTPESKGDVKFVKVPANGAGCPRCHASNSRIVFCPYCGSGMCANCTPLITPKESGFEYTCPKCGESVSVEKQAQ